MLAGGLAVIMLDLGRADRLVVAMTHFNPTSVFGWNVILYPGMFGIVAVYLWTMMERRMNPWTKPAGLAAFVWRLLLTTGTGSIFGFLIASDAYSSAIMAVLFIAASFLYGLAFTVLVLLTMSRETRHELISEDMLGKFRGLFILFALAVLYITAVFHLTKLYAPDYREVETFLLRDGGIYTLAFWVGQIGIGLLLPLAILVFRGSGRHAWHAVAIAAPLFLIGGVAQMYFTIIGGQAYPPRLFPGMQVSSSFHDGVIAQYWPSLPEVMLGVSGVSLAMLLTGVALKLLPFLPRPASV
jgi:molybdopterin-containing oxidoreductase family membrane subunit